MKLLCVTITTFLLSFSGFAETFNGPELDSDRTLHAFFFVDSAAGTVGDDIAPACKVGMELIDELLGNSFPEAGHSLRHRNPFGDMNTYRYVSKVFIERLTPASLLSRLKPGVNRSMSSEDSLLVFYCGHGGMNKANQHFLSMAGGNLARTQLWGQMTELDKSLSIGGGFSFMGLFTEACSNYVPNVLYGTQYSEGGKGTSIDPEILTYLFFHGGRVDMTSASPGQVAWSVGIGLFTDSLYKSLANKKKSDYWPDENSIPVWIDIFGAVSASTRTKFKDVKKEYADRAPLLKDSSDQVPYAWKLQYVDSYIFTVNRTGEAVNVKYQVYQPESGQWSPEFTHKYIPNGVMSLPDLRINAGTQIRGSHLRWMATTASGKRLGEWRDIDIRNFSKPYHPSWTNRYELILE